MLVMSHSIRSNAVDSHALLLGIGRPSAAKVSAKNLGNVELQLDWNQALGRALNRAIGLVGWSSKEAAVKVGVCEADFSKWLSGARRAHLDRILAVEELRRPFLVAIVGLTEKVEITITIPMSSAVNE